MIFYNSGFVFLVLIFVYIIGEVKGSGCFIQGRGGAVHVKNGNMDKNACVQHCNPKAHATCVWQGEILKLKPARKHPRKNNPPKPCFIQGRKGVIAVNNMMLHMEACRAICDKRLRHYAYCKWGSQILQHGVRGVTKVQENVDKAHGTARSALSACWRIIE